MKYWLFSCLLSVSLIVGCSNNDGATEADYDDIAQTISAVVVTDEGGGEVGSMYDSVTVATGNSDSGIVLDVTGKFVGSRLGLDYEYEVECTDAKGDALEKCGDTTDHAVVTVNWSGELVLPALTASVEREGEWQLSNVQSDAVEITGSSDFDLDAQFESIFRDASRTYHVGYSADYAKIKFDRSARRVTSGSVEYVIDAQRKASGPRRESTATFHMDGLLKFNREGSATLTLDDSYHYTIDTASGHVDKE